MTDYWCERGNNLFVNDSCDMVAVKVTDKEIVIVNFYAENYPSFGCLTLPFSEQQRLETLKGLQSDLVGWYVRKNNHFPELIVDSQGYIGEES